MRRLAIVIAILILSSVALFAGSIAVASRTRPDLVPEWARIGPFAPAKEQAAAEPEPSPLEDGPDDGWLAHLSQSGRPVPKGTPTSLHTIRLGSTTIADEVGIETAVAESVPIAPLVSGNAEISFVTHDYAHITSRVSGRIVEVPTDEGCMVRKGDVLVVVDSAEVGSAKAQFLTILPTADLARKEFRRISSLRSSGAATEKEELMLQAALTKAEAEVLNARQRLLNMGFTDPEIDRIAETKDTSNLLKIIAPMSGRLVERHAVTGEAVTPPTMAVSSGQMLALFDIADLSEMWAWIDVGEADVPKVKIGQEVEFTISGTNAPVFRGHVELVSYAVNASTRTVRVRAGLKNQDERLRANQYGRATIQVGPVRQAVVVPRDAVQSEGRDQFVFVPQPDGQRFRTQRVETQPTERSDHVEIVFGLKPGDRVVTTGSFLLKSELFPANMGGE